MQRLYVTLVNQSMLILNNVKTLSVKPGVFLWNLIKIIKDVDKSTSLVYNDKSHKL